MKRKWWLFILGLVIVAGSLAGWLYVDRGAEHVVNASALTATVTKGSIESVIRVTGNIEPADRETIVTTEKGEVDEVFFKDGDQVKKGDVLFTFVNENGSERWESLENSLENAQNTLEELQEQFKLAEDDETRNELSLDIRRTMLEIEQIQADMDSFEEDYGIDPVTAPIGGTLSGFDILPGETIEDDTDLGEIVNYSQMKLVVSIDEMDLSKIQVGQTAEIQVDALPDHTYTGTVTKINLEGNSVNGVAFFDVTITLNESDGLKSGMSAEAGIVTDRREDVLLVPVDAVIKEGDQYVVKVLNEDASVLSAGESEETYAKVPVEIGIVSEDVVEIGSGLSEGDIVLLNSAVSTESTDNDLEAPGLSGISMEEFMQSETEKAN